MKCEKYLDIFFDILGIMLKNCRIINITFELVFKYSPKSRHYNMVSLN